MPSTLNTGGQSSPFSQNFIFLKKISGVLASSSRKSFLMMVSPLEVRM